MLPGIVVEVENGVTALHREVSLHNGLVATTILHFIANEVSESGAVGPDDNKSSVVYRANHNDVIFRNGLVRS